MEAPKIEVYKHESTYYISKEDLPQGIGFNRIQVNGKTPKEVRIGYSQYFYLIEEPIQTIEEVIPQGKKITGFTLKPSLSHLYGCTAKHRPADYFSGDDLDWDSDNWSDERRLYEKEEEEVPPIRNPIEWDVIELKHSIKPVPDYVKIKFPAFLNMSPEFRHAFPCVIQSKDVYNFVHDAVEARVKELYPGRYKFNGYRNIQTFTVVELIDLGLIDASLKKHEIKIIDVVGSYKDKQAEKIKDIHGDNVDDVLEKLKAYTQTFLDRLDELPKKVLCAGCQGKGVV